MSYSTSDIIDIGSLSVCVCGGRILHTVVKERHKPVLGGRQHPEVVLLYRKGGLVGSGLVQTPSACATKNLPDHH